MEGHFSFWMGGVGELEGRLTNDSWLMKNTLFSAHTKRARAETHR